MKKYLLIKYFKIFSWRVLVFMAMGTILVAGPLSAADELILNGDAEALTDTNFPQATVSTDRPMGGGKCFEVTGPKTMTAQSAIPIDSTKNYYFSIGLQSRGTVESKAYVGFDCFDKNNKSIRGKNYYQPAITQTQLIRDLNNGDAEVYLAKADNWDNTQGASYNHKRNFAVFDDPFYNNPTNGKCFYTQKFATYNQVDFANHKLILTTPWAGGFIPRGTWVANTQDGSTYVYSLAANQSIPSGWTYSDAIVTGVNAPNDTSYGKFRPGTAFIKPLILANYSQDVTYKMAFDNFSLKDMAQITPTLETNYTRLMVNPNGSIIYLKSKSSDNNLLSAPAPISRIIYRNSDGTTGVYTANSFTSVGSGKYRIGYTGTNALVDIAIQVKPDHWIITLERAASLPTNTLLVSFFELPTRRVIQMQRDALWAAQAPSDALFLYTAGLNSYTTGFRYYDSIYQLSAGSLVDPPGGRRYDGASGIVVTLPKSIYNDSLKRILNDNNIPSFIYEYKHYPLEKKPVVWDTRAVTAKNTPVTITLKGFSAQSKPLNFSVITNPKMGTLGTITRVSNDISTVLYTPRTNSTGLDNFLFKSTDGTNTSQAATANIVLGIPAEGSTLSPRTPQWPLKTARRLWSDDQLNRARSLCATDPDGQAVLRNLKSQPWWLAKTPEEIRTMIPDWHVPRSFQDGTGGCPAHGLDIFRFGTYPWKTDKENPFTLICPVGGERYPENDYGAYYRSGFSEPRLLTGNILDPGRGWLAPDNEKRWMVSHANHWTWGNWTSGALYLAQAYSLSQDKEYALRAIAILDRIAEIYPNMKHNLQSRYSELSGGGYLGKVVNKVWETGHLANFSEAYDLVFDALISADPITLPWRNAAQIRSNIEANLLEDGIDAVKQKEILGNFGMHQQALSAAVAVRQNGPTAELLDLILKKNVTAAADEQGLSYALYNLFLKDGMPQENSPGYDSGWINNWMEVAKVMEKAGYDIRKEDKLRMASEVFLDLLCDQGRYTPNFGDSSSVTGKWVTPSMAAYKQMYLAWKTDLFAWAYGKLNGFARKAYTNFDDLVETLMPPEARAQYENFIRKVSSRFFDGLGAAILRSKNDDMSVVLSYGEGRSHSHKDRLSTELFAYGVRISPDLGYPDFMNAYVPGIFSWSTHNISHNTIQIDDQKHDANIRGRVMRFHRGDGVSLVDIDATGGAYAQSTKFNRTLMLVDTGDHAGYLVDVFRVKGGTKNYTLSLHGQEGTFNFIGATLPSPVTVGTYAGAGVSYGQLYDDPILGASGYSGSYGGYKGSGYSHLFNWQKIAPLTVVAGEWIFKQDPNVKMRLHVIPYPGQELVVSDAYVSPTKKINTILKYLLLKRTPAANGDTFITVWEPFTTGPSIDKIELVSTTAELAGSDAQVKLRITRTDGKIDNVLVAPNRGIEQTFASEFKTDAFACVLTRQGESWEKVFSAGASTVEKITDLSGPKYTPSYLAQIAFADYRNHVIRISTASLPFAPIDLIGRTVRISNALHQSIYEIKDALYSDGNLDLALTGSDIFIGRINLNSVDAVAKTVKTALAQPGYIMALWKGAHLVTDDKLFAVPIESVSSFSNGVHTIKLSSDISKFVEGADAWVADFGAGDNIEVEFSNLYLPQLLGDLSKDGKVTSHDAALVKKYLANPNANPLILDQLLRADVDGDDKITSADAVLIGKKAVGLIDKFPVEG